MKITLPASDANRFRDNERSFRRAAFGAGVGGVAGLICGIPLGGILGILYAPIGPTWKFAVCIGALAGAVSGFLVGPVIIIRNTKHRLVTSLLVGILSGGVLGAGLGNSIGNIHDGPPFGSWEFWRIVFRFAGMGVAAGSVGGPLVGYLLGVIRGHWPWITRWDPIVDPSPKG